MTLMATASVPGSLPNAAGGNCYFSQSECINGPNACTNAATDCFADYTTCSTGQAGPTTAWFFCQKDFAYGSIADGGGQLCYSASGSCFNGPNACNFNEPCGLDFTTCSTGPAGPTPNNWYCAHDTPVGFQTKVPALPAGSGMLCWDSVADCVAGPNACTEKSGDCVNTNATVRMCSTGLAAGNSLGNNVACLKDILTGGMTNAAGKWCYNTLGNCLNGTNACNSSALCVATPAAVCATAGGSSPYYCAYDYPMDVTKGLSTASNLCYRTALDCMNGPNACNTSFLCSSDSSMQGACKGSSYTFFCSLNIAAGSAVIPVPSSAAASSLASSLAVAVGAAAALLLPGVRVSGL
jgi:hypothetical protein